MRFGRQHGRLTVHAALFGLTPGSMHGVDLRLPGGGRVRFSPLTRERRGPGPRHRCPATTPAACQPGSWLAIRMGTGSRGVAANPIAVTRPLGGRPYRPHRLAAVEAGPASRGPLRGPRGPHLQPVPAHAHRDRLGQRG